MRSGTLSNLEFLTQTRPSPDAVARDVMALKPYFEKAGITLYNGDCREILPELAADSFDMAITDPPYLVAYAGRWGRDGKVIKGDTEPTWSSLFSARSIGYFFPTRFVYPSAVGRTPIFLFNVEVGIPHNLREATS